MTGVLNPELYSALRRRFGTVKLSNEGQRIVTLSRPNPLNPEQLREAVVDGGEYYRVCCPCCNDTRFRLYINHRWNTEGPDGKPYGKFMIVCFNERCDMRDFGLQLKPYLNHTPKIHRSDNAELSSVSLFKETQFPGECKPLLELPDFHPAIQYLKTRPRTEPFDPAELCKTWNLHYCVSHANPLIRGRIIIPVYRNQVMVGWQARAVGDHNIKYYTMPGLNKKAMLINGDRARHYRFCVLVEGFFDAMSVGPWAVPLLGKSVSYMQRQLLQDGWGNGAVGFMLDADAYEDMKIATEMFDKKSFKKGFFQVNLPPGTDPGKLSQKENWSYIVAGARANNVDLGSI
jgi:hypothetical protein